MKTGLNEEAIAKLLIWYQQNKRDLPWRHTNNPYFIWISEIMLQQTRVEKVKQYFERFIKVLPTLKDLAEVKEDKLLKLWEGLGYYSRAKNLKKCAQEIQKLNLETLPNDADILKKLPGIGPYTVGAILSIAYNECTPAIDGNVIRVLGRVYEEKREIRVQKVYQEYEEILKKYMKPKIARDFTESFIELGAVICLPKIPQCEICPLKAVCQSYHNKTMLEFPKKKQTKARKIENKTVYILSYKKQYVLLKRKEKGLLNGLYELPNMKDHLTEKQLQKTLEQQQLKIEKIAFLGDFKHIFSHLEWHMKAYDVELKEKPVKMKLYTKEDIIKKYSLPTAFQKIFRKIK